MPTFDEARARMVAEQLESRGISDRRVLDVMLRVPRHVFVPANAQMLSYADRALPIGEGQTISQPYMVALMTEALHLSGTERVLEIGTGSGYQAAVLAELAAEVITVERRPELASIAQNTLAALGYRNVDVVVADGSVGREADAPFDAILVAAGAPHLPASLKQQLADGGRLVIPIGNATDQVLTVVTRSGATFQESSGEACVFVPLIGQEGWPT